MKLAEFNDLCHREYASDRGIVTRLTLSRDEYLELCTDVLSGGVTVTGPVDIPAGQAGATLTQIINPATIDGHGTPVPVSIGFVTMIPDDGGFSGTAEVRRWVQIREDARTIEIRQRPPEEVRERLLSSSLPHGLASVLADEMAPEGT